MELIDWVTGLADDEIAMLDDALDARRIRLDMSPALLRSYGWPESWSERLAALDARGHDLRELALATRVARRERARAGERRVDLVCTRPSGGRVDVLDTSVAVRRLFTQAQREVIVAGFRINDREMLEPLRRTASRPVGIRLYVDIDPAHTADGRKQPGPVDLALWPGVWWSQFMDRVWPERMDPPRCWYAPSTLGPDARGVWRSMHAKSVVVDRRYWFVTSANFTRRGHERNIEVGALVDDPVRAGSVADLLEEWAGAGVFVPVRKSTPGPPIGVER